MKWRRLAGPPSACCVGWSPSCRRRPRCRRHAGTVRAPRPPHHRVERAGRPRLDVVTTNDSGDSCPRLHGRARRAAGPSASPTSTPSVVDVEALAPAGGRARSGSATSATTTASATSISVYRVTVGAGPHRRHTRRRYPPRLSRRAAPDAESLFVDRAGPAARDHQVLRRRHRLPRAGAAEHHEGSTGSRPSVASREFATDAALLRDGRHLIVRGPQQRRRLHVARLPAGRVASRCRAQPQGEGISVGPTARIRVEQRGCAQRRTQVPCLPASPAATRRCPPPVGRRPRASPPRRARHPVADRPRRRRAAGDDSSSERARSIDPPWLMWCIPAVIAVGALGIGLGLRRRTE